jgi:hypothetical protein
MGQLSSSFFIRALSTIATTTAREKDLAGPVPAEPIGSNPRTMQQAAAAIDGSVECAQAPAAPATSTAERLSSVPDEQFWTDLEQAATWKMQKVDWDYRFCRFVVRRYDLYLKTLIQEQKAQSHTTEGNNSSTDTHTEINNDPIPPAVRQRLLSAETLTMAFKVLVRGCRFTDTRDLGITVRQWEKYVGTLGETPLTDHLSLRLLTANAKAGNLGRCLALLELRAQKKYPTRLREIYAAIRAIRVAAAVAALPIRSQHQRRRTIVARPIKNIFIPDTEQPALDNPTRWLDAILIHMKKRGFPLTTPIANAMLKCYAGAGYTGKASHHFYRVQRKVPTENDDKDGEAASGRPKDWYYNPQLNTHQYRPTQVRIVYRKEPPPFYKVPALSKGKSSISSRRSDGSIPLRLEQESEPEFSIPLAAAFAFADSLQLGACGHDPVAFDIASYNALIRACVYRGALYRAMYVLNVIIPNASENNINTNKDGTGNVLAPNHTSYNLILFGLARVGDVVTAQEYYWHMIRAGLTPNANTVQAIVDGLLNVGDSPAAVTVVQDFFNQHCVLPPYTTLCKILEFCLSLGMVYEAKRFVYFIQQLWHWEPVEGYHTPEVVAFMRATQSNTQLQKPALQKMFAYFGEKLEDNDFL